MASQMHKKLLNWKNANRLARKKRRRETIPSAETGVVG
jgi:hypothetical protein